jgi:hypothetical protein
MSILIDNPKKVKYMILTMKNESQIYQHKKPNAQSSRRLRQKLTECASHTTERTGHVLGGSQSDGFNSI